MYDRYIETLIIVADCGSLTKASELLHLSTTAIMKQINNLEEQLDIQIFIRTHRGLKLSEAGKSIYNDAKYIIEYSKDSINRAKKIERSNDYFIRIGTSLMNPCQRIAPLLHQIKEKNSNFKYQIIPFDDYRDSYTKTISQLGNKIDIIAEVYGFSDWTTKLHNTVQLSLEPICIAVSQNHRLASKSSIKIDDLENESIYITDPGDSKILDNIKSELENLNLNINFIHTHAFDFSLFNQCEVTHNIILTTPTWAYLHPMLKIIPVEWNYTVPFGIIYPRYPTPSVKAFIKELQKINSQEKCH